MPGLVCPACNQPKVEPLVRVVKYGRILESKETLGKAAKWAEENIQPPYVLKTVYVCQRCKHEQEKGERTVA